jgi:hypothetical protein
MSRISTDSIAYEQPSVTSIIESYLFDLPDGVHLQTRCNEVWPAAILHDARLQWGQRHGTLLHKASEEGRLLWVQALLARGADPWQLAESDGLPAIGWAAQAQQTACVLHLLRQTGPCPNPKEGLPTTLFHVMLAQTDPVAVEAWVQWWQAHGDPLCVPLFDRPDAHGLFPTHVFTHQPMATAAGLERLFDLGFSAHAQDGAGRTPMERLYALQPALKPVPVVAPVRPRAVTDGPRFRRRVPG